MTVSECEVNSVTIYFWETDAATLEPDDISGPLVTNTCMGGGFTEHALRTVFGVFGFRTTV